MREVAWKPLAEAQFNEACKHHPRLKEAVGGALRAISYAGYNQPLAAPPDSDLRLAWTNKGHGSPGCVLTFSDDTSRDRWLIESFALRPD